MRLTRLSLVLALAAFSLFAFAGCAAQTQRPAEQAFIANSQGQVSAGTRSALDGSPAPGRQEILAFYLPPILGLPGAPDFRAGITLDPSGLQFPIIIPPPTFAAPAVAPSACAGPQIIEEQVTEMVPETRMVPRTRTVRRAIVPIPQEAPRVNPCAPAPAPQAAPPQACNGDDCDPPTFASR